MAVTIKPVQTKEEKLQFVKSQWNFYKGDKNFVPPLIADRMKLLDTVKNPFYQHSKIQLWIAEDSGKIVGRIAAIVNDNHLKIHNDKTGFWGFFECVNDQNVANLLFDTAAKWLKERGIDNMIGPENPSINDEIGMLFEGVDEPPIILMTYNPLYYNDLCNNYGMVKAKDLFAYMLYPETFKTDKVTRLQGVIRERHKITLREINLKNKVQFAKDVQTLKDIYNGAWVPNWGFVKWTDAEFDFLAADLKQIADQRLAVIAEINGKIAGFGLALPDFNQVLIHNKKGSMLGLIWHMLTKKKKMDQCRIIALGVMPEFQKTGLDAVLYYEVGVRGTDVAGFRRGEASWILEDNEMMNRGLTTTMHGEIYKKYRLYQKPI